MIKKGLKVKVLTGKDKNKEGEIIETLSPVLNLLFSSCALYFFLTFITFFSSGWEYFLSTTTVIVLLALSLTTIPFNIFLGI